MSRPKHTSKAFVNARVNRKEMPRSEARLWSAIRGQTTGARFRRQVPIGRWIADFASFDPRLVIEVDGPSHDFSDERRRSDYLASQGFTILRFDNDDIQNDLAGVCLEIEGTVIRFRSGVSL